MILQKIEQGVLRGIVFDKDGTLFHHDLTWDHWTKNVIYQLANAFDHRAAALAKAIDFDLDTEKLLPHSALIAGTHDEAVALFNQVMPNIPRESIDGILRSCLQDVVVVPTTDLIALTAYFTDLGVQLAVMTNDLEEAARSQLASIGALSCFSIIVGADSGHGAKPSAQPLLHCAANMGLAPHECLMVGDSLHDLRAGQAAGMMTLGVLTGPANKAELAPYADFILPSLHHLLTK